MSQYASGVNSYINNEAFLLLQGFGKRGDIRDSISFGKTRKQEFTVFVSAARALRYKV